MILAKITIKWRAAVCEAQGSSKGPKLMIKGIKEAQGRLREALGTEKALKGTTSVLEAGLTPTVQQFCRTCLTCQLNKTERVDQPPAGEEIEPEGFPGIILHVDNTQVSRTT